MLPGRAVRVRGGFDYRYRDVDLRDRLNAFQNGFVKSRLARLNLKLGPARNPVHGLVKCRQHTLIRGMHAYEYAPCPK